VCRTRAEAEAEHDREHHNAGDEEPKVNAFCVT
jgi:hypothetical protein